MSKKHFFVYGGVAMLLAGGIFAWHSIFFPVHTLRVSFLSVGEGRAILIQSPTGENILVDGGPDHAVLRALGDILGPLDRTLDLVVETNPSAGNIGGLEGVFARYHIRAFMATAVSNNTTASRMIAKAAGSVPRLAYLAPVRGASISLGGGAFLKVLFPDRDVSQGAGATGSTVLRLRYGRTAFLFPSDSPAPVQRWLAMLDASTTLSSEVLAIGHHGAAGSVDTKWLTEVHPHYAVISVGRNSYGYPATSTRARLAAAGAQVETTRERGTITFISNGKSIVQE